MVTEILRDFEAEVASITLIPSDGGRFEVTVNDTLIYSKLRTHRHVEADEINLLIHKLLKEAL